MPEVVIPIVTFGAFAVATLIVARFGARESAKVWARVQGMATRLGLGLPPPKLVLGMFYPPPRATGMIRGKRVEIFNFSTGSGKSRKTWSALSAAPQASGGLTFSFVRQGLGTRLRGMFGAKEIKVGDRVFDEHWFIETNQPDFFRAALLPELRVKFSIREGATPPGSFTLEDGVVKYVEAGSFSSDEKCARFEHLIEVVCDLADVAEVWAAQKPAK